MSGPWCQDFDALFIRTPLQNIDVDMAHAPAFHLQTRGFEKIDCAAADQSGAVSMDDKCFGGLHDFEPCSTGEARPSGSSAVNNAAGKTPPHSVTSSAAAAF